MTTDLCAEDVVVELAPQVNISGEGGTNSGTGLPTVASGAATATPRPGNVVTVELGRRLLLAARAGDTALVLDLMAQGAPFTTDWLGTSPLHLAASNDHVATCGVLLRAGVYRDSRTKVERTPLHLAAAAGHSAVVTLLLHHGASVDSRDLLRMTPLHWAAQRGHLQVAQALLKHGADPTAVSKFNKTPMQLAARAGHVEVLKLLEDAVRQKEEARSVKALVGERIAEQETNETPQPQTFATIQKLPEIKGMIEIPDKPQVKVTKPKITITQEKVINVDRTKPTKTTEDKANTGGDTTAEGDGDAAAILRRHGITLLPPDTGGTVLSALQSGRTVVLSDAGKLMLQESIPSAVPAPARASPPQVKLIQLPADARAGVRRVSTAAPTPTIAKSRPPVKIIMNKSNFKKLVAGVQKPTNITAVETPVAVSNVPKDEVSELKAQLAASQRIVARLQEELNICRAKLAQYEGQ